MLYFDHVNIVHSHNMYYTSLAAKPNFSLLHGPLQVVDIAGKGRGVAPTRAFKRGELLCEYAGELLTEEEAKRVEQEYRKDPSIGCYMYYFSHQGKRCW